jgi:hypothetical protein
MPGPRTFLVLNLDRMQQMRLDVAKRMRGFTDAQLGPKHFYGPVVYQNPLELDYICGVVYAQLMNIVSPERGGPAWSIVQPLTRPLFANSVQYFQLSQPWVYRHPELPGPITGLVYLEFVAEYLGTNERGAISRLGWFAQDIPANFHCTYLTVSLWDTGGWVDQHGTQETLACRALQQIEVALIGIFGIQPLVGQDGSPWMRIQCQRAQ